jgi:hypothetical protein
MYQTNIPITHTNVIFKYKKRELNSHCCYKHYTEYCNQFSFEIFSNQNLFIHVAMFI